MNPADIPLPDPLFDYLDSVLPPWLYSLLINASSYLLAFVSALLSLAAPMLSTNPWEWDAQTVLPPLITFLVAYLALLSLYRTTTWMLRMGMWFIKWGTIFGALMAGAGWYLGNTNANGVGHGGGGIANGIGGLVLDMFNGQGRNAAGGERSSRSRSQKTRADRPKAWDSFDKHRDWQYKDDGANKAEGGSDVQRIVDGIVGAVREGMWWEVAKNLVGSVGDVAKPDKAGQKKESKRTR